MFVSDILKGKSTSIISVASDHSVEEALALLAQHRIGAVLVMDAGGSIAGILSERDLVRAMSRLGKQAFDQKVGDLMTTTVVTCTSKDPVGAIEGMMTSQRFRHVPVVDEGRLVGMISIGDVVKARIEEAEAEVDALRRYIAL